MKTFYYQAVNQTGGQIKGEMQAHNEADLEMRLQKMALDLMTASVVNRVAFRFMRPKVSHRDLMMFCFQLEQLLSAGVPILQALNDLKTHVKQTDFSMVIGTVATEVENGKILSDALSMHPHVFNTVFVHLIVAGEKTGRLPQVLQHLSQTLKWQAALLTETRRLLTYPIFILVVVMAAIIFLMVMLVPELLKFINTMGQTLPWNTKVLIWLSSAFVHYWWLIVGVPIAAVIMCRAAIRSSVAAQRWFDHLKLTLPIVGTILHKAAMARFARYFALMYQAGIPVLQAIKVCEGVVVNRAIASRLHVIYEEVSAGASMHDSFQQAGLFPALVTRMIQVGEQTGALDKALVQISDFYESDIDALLQRALKMLEPTLTIVLGFMLMFIMTAVLGPIYHSFKQMPL